LRPAEFEPVTLQPRVERATTTSVNTIEQLNLL
jgi:hypothetical protein